MTLRARSCLRDKVPGCENHAGDDLHDSMEAAYTGWLD